MKLTIFGTGYVGCVSAACFAKFGHDVTGVDLDPDKASAINLGRCPVLEPGVNELFAEALKAGRLRGETSASSLGDASMICVGTPSQENGAVDLSHVYGVSEQIGRLIARHDGYHVVIVRSTVSPGTIEREIIPRLERESGKRNGIGFGVAMNPEFLRETTAVKDFFDPPFTVIGAAHERTADVVAALYAPLTAPVHRTSIGTAEMVKYTCNAFHAVKVTFANEIGNVCTAYGVDSHEVMRLVCEDRKLNLSPYYMKPGFAFGGSCLPKDMRGLLRAARVHEVPTPMLEGVLPSNRTQIHRAFELIQKTGLRRVVLLGLSFKAGTDDLRESPLVFLAEQLLGKGFELSIHDPDIDLVELRGTNRRFVDRALPHLSRLLQPDLAKICADSEIIIVGKNSPENREIVGKWLGKKPVIDLVRLPIPLDQKPSGYQGICW